MNFMKERVKLVMIAKHLICFFLFQECRKNEVLLTKLKGRK